MSPVTGLGEEDRAWREGLWQIDYPGQAGRGEGKLGTQITG